MCYGCYKRCGKPVVINDRVLAAADLIGKVYEACSVGGSMHIVVDDWSLEDSSIDYCLSDENDAWARKTNDENTGAGGPPFCDRETDIACLTALRALTEDERATALAINDRFIDRTGRSLIPA